MSCNVCLTSFRPDFTKTLGTFSSEPDGADRRLLPLHYAVESRSPIRILDMVKRSYPDALTTKAGRYKETPLHIACRKGIIGPALLQLLASTEVMRTGDFEERLPLHAYCRWNNGVNGNGGSLDLEQVKLLVEEYPDGVQVVDCRGATPQHLASTYSRECDLPVIQFLMGCYPKGLDVVDQDEGTPLHYACEMGESASEEVVRVLVKACPQTLNMRNGRGDSPLHLLYGDHASNLYLPAGAFMIESYPESLLVGDKNGRTVVHHLILSDGHDENDLLDAVQEMVNACPEVLKIVDEWGSTPLHLAISWRRGVEFIRFLFEKCPEVMDSNEKYIGGLPLFALLKSDEDNKDDDYIISCLKIFGKESATAFKAKNVNSGITVFHWMCLRGVSTSVLQFMAEICPDLPSLKDNFERIPLYFAISGSCPFDGSSSTETWYYSEMSVRLSEVVKFLLEKFPRGVRAKDSKGMTPLEYACENNAPVTLIYQLVSVDPIFSLGLETRREARGKRKRKSKKKRKRKRRKQEA